MEALYLYLIKSSGLLALFFVAYHLLLRKETFFTSNRWFLILGLITSVVLPFVAFTKIVWVEPSKNTIDWSQIPLATSSEKVPLEINWYLVIGMLYAIGMLLFLLKLALDFYSLHRVLKGKHFKNQADFKYIDTTENIAPFSFFNTIVYNSSLYSKAELENILKHEKVHSEQNHTVDVLISRLFCIVFWFNPFIWLYKKAILQNLEFIADSEATKKISDKKAYQLTLLKITTHENCVAITNHFYQSLIKKRIVMLNKNQSKKWNSWKYAVIVPALVAFVFLFQIKVLAQEQDQIENKEPIDVDYTIDRYSTDEDIKEDIKSLKKDFNINCQVKGIKRNSDDDIIALNIELIQESGEKSTITLAGNTPIQEIKFECYFNNIGQGKVRIYSGEIDKKKKLNTSTSSLTETEEDSDYIDSIHEELSELTPPTPPTPPNHPYENLMEAPFAPDYPEVPQVPSNIFNKKAMEKYEKEMATYELKLKKIEPKIKDFERKLALYDIEMKKLDPAVKDYDKEMKVFEKEMKIFEKEMNEYELQYEKISQKLNKK
ncbi:peptidase M56 [Flavobacterium sp. SOK18b]|uniref:M56 family metallopeptidase n=1 Tax=Flavobacterium sp. SOK18b TaxID=797900 RepID=UPI0015F7EE6F|nr:M56 family metallopeptidase [Flavobacterium sp. SOK18b]MBB1194756.1 peptidase M56 [Flavobacterium sp. SOK18b]